MFMFFSDRIPIRRILVPNTWNEGRMENFPVVVVAIFPLLLN